MIRPARRADIARAAEIFARAFDTTPQWRWMIGDDRARGRVLPAFFRPTLAHAMKRGRLDVSVGDDGRINGAIAWLPSDAWEPPVWRTALVAPALLVGMSPGQLREFGVRGSALDKAAKAAHPTEPHWYLAGVAVDPDSQAGGVGRGLLNAGPEGAAYLECEESLVAYYERFGFEVIHRIDPGNGVPVQMGMWRAA